MTCKALETLKNFRYLGSMESMLDEYRAFLVFGEEEHRSVADPIGSFASIQNLVKRG